jgi:hypothetical protein
MIIDSYTFDFCQTATILWLFCQNMMTDLGHNTTSLQMAESQFNPNPVLLIAEQNGKTDTRNSHLTASKYKIVHATFWVVG